MSLIRRSLSVFGLWGSPVYRTPHAVITLTFHYDQHPWCVCALSMGVCLCSNVCACTYVSGSQTTSPLHFNLMMSSVTSSDKMEGRCSLWLESTPYRGKLSQEKFHCEFSEYNVICKSLSRKHFALAKPHNSLSMVIPRSTIAAVSEAVKKTLNNDTGPVIMKHLHIFLILLTNPPGNRPFLT